MARRIRTGGAFATAIALAFAVSACGSDHASEPPGPPIQPATAAILAKESERVAADLDAGDPCGALDRARVLKRQSKAIATGLPAAVRDQLDAGIDHLISRIECVPPAPPPPPQGDDGNKKDEGHGKGKQTGGTGVGGPAGHCPPGHETRGGPGGGNSGPGGKFDCSTNPKDE